LYFLFQLKMVTILR